MELTILAPHPLIDHKIGLLRSVETASPTCRALVNEISALLVYEATKHLRTKTIEITTPLVETTGRTLSKSPRPLIVPILRAGLGMLEAFQQAVPIADVGFFDMKRDEQTLAPVISMDKVPTDLTGRQCLVIDPMLATGGSLLAALTILVERHATDITACCLIAAPEGLVAVRAFALKHPDLSLRLIIAERDKKLNQRGYIVPGLGDAGDRLYGVEL